MKKRISVSVLIVIIIADMVGLFGIFYLKHCFDIQASSYNLMVDQSFDEKNDIDQIESLIYEHEFKMSNMLRKKDSVSIEEAKRQIVEVELSLRHRIIEHGSLMSKIKNKEKFELFRSVNDDVLNYLNYNAVLLSITQENFDEENIKYVESFVTPLIKRVNSSIEQLSVLSEQQIEQVRNELNTNLKRSGIISYVAICLMVISIVSSLIYTYKIVQGLETDKDILTFKTELNKQRIAEIQNNTIIGIADLVESRSGETGQHVKRTSNYVNLILNQAKKHGLWPELLTEQYIDFVTRAAPMHDIGKIVIPDSILNKPGKLTSEEFEIMKTHAEAGSKIVNQILGGVEDYKYVEIAADIAHYHHEKWNGKGYPTGRRRTEIPLCARIMAVADVFDALVSERCYKKAMSYSDAFNLIESEAGQHFDPKIVELFMELKDEISKGK